MGERFIQPKLVTPFVTSLREGEAPGKVEPTRLLKTGGGLFTVPQGPDKGKASTDNGGINSFIIPR